MQKIRLKEAADQPMLLALAKTISNYQIYPVSMTIVVDDFKNCSLDERRWLTGASFRKGKLVRSGAPSKPYFLPFTLLVQRITDYAKPGSKAHFFCGLDRPFAEYASSLFAKIKTDPPDPHSEWASKSRLGDIAFPMASQTPELQAADLLAHLSYLHMLERSYAQVWQAKPSPLLALCLRNTRSQRDHAYQNKQALTETFAKAVQIVHARRKLPKTKA